MNLSKNIDEVPEVVSQKPQPGGYVFCVENCIEQKTKRTFKDMFVFELDIYSGPFAGYFSDQPIKFYQVADEKNYGRLSHIVNIFNQSNPTTKPISGSVIEPTQFTGLFIGAVLYLDEYIPGYTNLKIDRLISLQDLKAGKFTIPPKKESWRLQKNQHAQSSANLQSPPDDGAPPIGDDDLPF